MKLNHFNLPSSDPASMAAFLETYLEFTRAPAPGHWFLKRPGFDLVIEDAEANSPHWPGSFHIGFELPSRADIESLYARMLADGVQMETEVIDHERGSRFFCRAPGGVMFELNTRADASPEYRGTFD